MHRMSKHIALRFLTTEQKEKQMTISGDLIDEANKDPGFLSHNITSDETWCHFYLFILHSNEACVLNMEVGQLTTIEKVVAG